MADWLALLSISWLSASGQHLGHYWNRTIFSGPLRFSNFKFHFWRQPFLDVSSISALFVCDPYFRHSTSGSMFFFFAVPLLASSLSSHSLPFMELWSTFDFSFAWRISFHISLWLDQNQLSLNSCKSRCHGCWLLHGQFDFLLWMSPLCPKQHGRQSSFASTA